MDSKNAREILQTFYDTFGWRVDPETGRYFGQILHEDLDSATQRYMEDNELRYRKHFRGGGRNFLDAGCGAEPRRGMSHNFSRHTCVDISIVGLRESRRQIGEAGRYIQADLTALPFVDGAFDGTLASHCLYHIDRDLQHRAVGELCRVTAPGRTVLIFYDSNHNLISILQKFAMGLGKLRRILFGQGGANDGKSTHETRRIAAPPIYFHAHNPFWLAREFNSVDVSCLRILTRYETRILGKLHLLKPSLPLVEAMEKALPHAMVFFGKYTAIRIKVES